MRPKCRTRTGDDALCQKHFREVLEEPIDPTRKLRNPQGFGVEHHPIAEGWEAACGRLDEIPDGESLDGNDYWLEEAV